MPSTQVRPINELLEEFISTENNKAFKCRNELYHRLDLNNDQLMQSLENKTFDLKFFDEWTKSREQESQTKMLSPRVYTLLGLKYISTAPPDYIAAKLFFDLAVKQEEPIAQNAIGKFYKNGWGRIAENAIMAVEWFQKSANQGYAAAQLNLGHHYQEGKGVAKNEKLAGDWFQKAAEQDYTEAQWILGCRYEDGLGLAKDEKVAVQWFRKAAEQGYAEAQYRLANCYRKGFGIAKDEKVAVQWFRKAAEQDYAEGMQGLGYCYYLGIGVAKDEKVAVQLLQKAAAQGSARAQENLKEIQRKKGAPAMGMYYSPDLSFAHFSFFINQEGSTNNTSETEMHDMNVAKKQA